MTAGITSKKVRLTQLLQGKDRITVSYSVDKKYAFQTASIKNATFELTDDHLLVNREIDLPLNEDTIKEIICEMATIDFLDDIGHRVIAKVIAR